MCVLDPEPNHDPFAVAFKLPKADLPERMASLADQIKAFIRDDGRIHVDHWSSIFDHLVVEQPPYMSGRPGQAYVYLAAGVAIGALRSNIQFKDITLVAPGTWKKVVCGNGNASKAEIKTAVLSAFPGLTTSQDAADAAGIALWFARRRNL